VRNISVINLLIDNNVKQKYFLQEIFHKKNRYSGLNTTQPGLQVDRAFKLVDDQAGVTI